MENSPSAAKLHQIIENFKVELTEKREFIGDGV